MNNYFTFYFESLTMARNNLVTFSALLLLPTIVSLATACDYLPGLWCSSKDIASKCKVRRKIVLLTYC